MFYVRNKHKRDSHISTAERSLIYVSRKVIAPTNENAVDDIVAISRVRNSVLRVTGTLISARGYFAQILEGPSDAIDELMASINRDPRHAEVTVLRYATIAERRFPGWSMAYSGPSNYLAGNIAPLVGCNPAMAAPQIGRLILMMSGLATDQD